LTRAGAAWRMLHAVHRHGDEVAAYPDGVLTESLRRLRTGGPGAFASWLHSCYVQQGAPLPAYERWMDLYGDTIDVDRSIKSPRLISVLLPTFNTPEVWLRRCLDSVLAQSYPHWELCIADDASTQPQVRHVLEAYAARDDRIRVTWRDRNGHISAASNSALAMARGDHIALLDHDDELHPQALALMAAALQRHPQWRMAYSDEDKLDTEGRRYDPYFKPDWNPDLFFGQNCISHLGVYERALVNAVGGFREGLEGSQDWDLALRCIERLRPDQIGHVPHVLYHWRAVQGSTAQGVDQKSYAHDAGLRAVREHFDRLGRADTVVMEIEGRLGMFRVRHPLPSILPLISIVIPTRDQVRLLRQCIESILSRTSYANYEIVIVDNQSIEDATLNYFDELAAEPRVRVLPHDQPFNYSQINNAAIRQCRGELVCLLNNDIEIITADWLEEMASQALRPHVGAVGAMLYYPGGTIQHAGVITGVHGVAAHPYSGMPKGYPGQMSRTLLTQSLSAVTAACLVVRRAVYLEVGGLDETLAVAFNDVDFCLRLRACGYTNIWTPFAELYHHESASRGHEDTPEKTARFRREVEQMKRRWGNVLEHDPAYNPNLTLAGEPFTLAFPPRAALFDEGYMSSQQESVMSKFPLAEPSR
jgi:glycosyltransferase involved in cell wall biosynthesis